MASGLVCADCRADLAGNVVLAPEQISSRSSKPTRAGLVDAWGRAHLLDARATVGRDLGGDTGVIILATSISRQHAKIAFDNGTWTVCDLGSSNGTFIDDTRVDGAAVLHTKDKIRFGQVSLYFFDQVEHVPVGWIDSETVRPSALAAPDNATEKVPLSEPSTQWSEIRLHEPTGGGGGILEVDGRQIQLTLAQMELVGMLIERMEAEAERDQHVRGFVPVAELLGKISLEVSMPRDAHVRQLIRRVRRSFVKADLEDLIESRYGLGYRIRPFVRVRK